MSTQSTANVTRFANLTTDELTSKARQWDEQRTLRGVIEFTAYRLLPGGALINVRSGEIYEVGASTGRCTCPDEVERLAPLRCAMAKALCGCPCECKHARIRALLAGQGVRIGRSLIFAKTNL